MTQPKAYKSLRARHDRLCLIATAAMAAATISTLMLLRQNLEIYLSTSAAVALAIALLSFSVSFSAVGFIFGIRLVWNLASKEYHRGRSEGYDRGSSDTFRASQVTAHEAYQAGLDGRTWPSAVESCPNR